MVHICLHYQQIPSVSSKLCLSRSRPWLVLTHVEKGNYLILNFKSVVPHSRYSVEMSTVDSVIHIMWGLISSTIMFGSFILFTMLLAFKQTHV